MIKKGLLGIGPTFLKLDSRSPEVGFVPIISTKGINEIKKGNCKKKTKFHEYKKIYYIFRNMGAIRVGAIPLLPNKKRNHYKKSNSHVLVLL